MFPNWGKRVLAMQFVDLERRSYAAHPMTSSRGIVVFRGSLRAIFLSLLCSWWTCADSLTRCFAVRLLPNFLWVRFPGANHRQTKMSRESKRERKRKKKGSEVTSGAMYLLGKWDGGRLLLQERRLYYYTGYGHSITRGNNMLLMCLAHLFTSSRAASMSFERYFSFLVTSLSISRFFSWQLSLLSAQLSSGRRNALSSR